MSARSTPGRAKSPTTLGTLGSGWHASTSSQSSARNSTARSSKGLSARKDGVYGGSLYGHDRLEEELDHHSRHLYLNQLHSPKASFGSQEALKVAKDVEIAQPGVVVPNSVKVHACGQNLEVSFSDMMSLPSLQSVLGTELRMPNQVFDICDSQGKVIYTNSDFLGAVSIGATPLTASLPEASIHLIESRREELSQMQWKLVRDQLAGLSEKILHLGNGLEDLVERMGRQTKDVELSSQRLRQEMTGLIDSVQEVARQNHMRLDERIEAALQLIHLERNGREATKQSLERQVQSIRDLVEADRSTRRSEISSLANVIEEHRSLLLEEGQARAALEERLVGEIHTCGERLDNISRAQNDNALDFSDRVQQVSQETYRDLEGHAKQALQDKVANDTMRSETNLRLQVIEERIATWEARLRENVNRQGGKLDEMWMRFDSMQHVVEQARIEERAKSLGLRCKSPGREEADEQQQKPKEVPQRSPSAPGLLLQSPQRTSSLTDLTSPVISVAAGPSPVNASGMTAVGNGLSLVVSQPSMAASMSQVSLQSGTASPMIAGQAPPGPARQAPQRSPVSTAAATRAPLSTALSAKPTSPRASVAVNAASAGAAKASSLPGRLQGPGRPGRSPGPAR